MVSSLGASESGCRVQGHSPVGNSRSGAPSPNEVRDLQARDPEAFLKACRFPAAGGLGCVAATCRAKPRISVVLGAAGREGSRASLSPAQSRGLTQPRASSHSQGQPLAEEVCARRLRLPWRGPGALPTRSLEAREHRPRREQLPEAWPTHIQARSLAQGAGGGRSTPVWRPAQRGADRGVVAPEPRGRWRPPRRERQEWLSPSLRRGGFMK